MHEFVRSLTNLIVYDEYESILIELTPVNVLDPNVYEFEGLRFKIFNGTNLITAQEIKFGTDIIQVNNLEYMDELFENTGPGFFSRNHVLISINHINVNKITAELLEKINKIGAKYYAVYYLSETDVEEVKYGQFVEINGN